MVNRAARGGIGSGSRPRPLRPFIAFTLRSRAIERTAEPPSRTRFGSNREGAIRSATRSAHAARWHDGWGPMCLDAARVGADADMPVVWMDHEVLITMGEDACRDRAALLPHVQLLYETFHALLDDLFAVPT